MSTSIAADTGDLSFFSLFYIYIYIIVISMIPTFQIFCTTVIEVLI